MSNFNYPYTCPDIDSSINMTKEDVSSELVEMLSRITEYKSIGELVDVYAEAIYELVDRNFESIRESNASIRDAAESQITEAENELFELQTEYDNEVRDLEQQIDELRDELYSSQEE